MLPLASEYCVRVDVLPFVNPVASVSGIVNWFGVAFVM
jgi:hypothetical protein